MQFDSKNYWENRYATGGNSGPGSYGRLAEYKAEYINDFISTQQINSVIEFGCGDGNQLKLAKYPKYLGFDVSQTSIELCLQTFAEDETKSFIFYTPSLFKDSARFIKGDVTMSLDVIYHLIEDDKFERHMQDLFLTATRFVIIYSSNSTDDIPAEHVRHRRFTDYVESNFPEWKLVREDKNRFPYDPSDPVNTSHSDFFIFEK